VSSLDKDIDEVTKHLNVLGTALKICCTDPMTGFYRTGSCEVGVEDKGVHAVCVKLTPEFLQFSSAVGNDLVTPRPEFGFAGLKPGDRWCLCAGRWQEAFEANLAPPVYLEATHEDALNYSKLEDLKQHALDRELN